MKARPRCQLETSWTALGLCMHVSRETCHGTFFPHLPHFVGAMLTASERLARERVPARRNDPICRLSGLPCCLQHLWRLLMLSKVNPERHQSAYRARRRDQYPPEKDRTPRERDICSRSIDGPLTSMRFQLVLRPSSQGATCPLPAFHYYDCLWEVT